MRATRRRCRRGNVSYLTDPTVECTARARDIQYPEKRPLRPLYQPSLVSPYESPHSPQARPFQCRRLKAKPKMCHLAIVGHENCRPRRPPTSHSLSRRRRYRTPQQVKTKASRRRWHCNQHHFIIYKQVARRRLRYTICLYRQHTKPPGFLLASLT